MLAEVQRVEAIPVKRTAPPQTNYLEHEKIETLFKSLPRLGTLALRDRALFMRTFANVEELAKWSLANAVDGAKQTVYAE
jgi:integrase/recombinase XerD